MGATGPRPRSARCARVPAVAGRLAGAVPRFERAGQLSRLLGPMPTGERLLALAEVTSPEERASLNGGVSAAEAAAERLSLVDGVRADVGDRPLLDQALYVDTHLFLPDRLLICADKMSMAHALEHRVPFLDVELMRWVDRVPGA